MARIHTLEDDITFERVRHLPHRTRVCSVHRQLTWACKKEIQMYEKDTRVTTNNMERSRMAMQGKYRELENVKIKLCGNETSDKNAVIERSKSCQVELAKLERAHSLLAISKLSSRFVMHDIPSANQTPRAQTQYGLRTADCSDIERSITMFNVGRNVAGNTEEIDKTKAISNKVD